MNPALVAAALNQAGWGLIGNLQNQPEPNFNQGFNNGPNNNSGKGSVHCCLDGLFEGFVEALPLSKLLNYAAKT